MTLNVIPLLQAFSSGIHRTFVPYFTRFQLTARSRDLSATAGLLVKPYVIDGGTYMGLSRKSLSVSRSEIFLVSSLSSVFVMSRVGDAHIEVHV